MSTRINEGYIITDSIHVGEMEFVLGVHSKAPSQFVTWACKGGSDYFWEHYTSDLYEATKDLIARAEQELQYCQSIKDKARSEKARDDDVCL